jgi:hypothetical protein
MHALLQETSFIGDQHGIRVVQLFQNVTAKLIPRRICIPTSPVQQVLYAIWSRFPHPLGQLPPVLPLTVAEQALQIGETAFARFRARKQACYAVMAPQQLTLPTS